MPTSSTWSFDHKLSISTCITLISAIIAVASMAATVQKRLDVIEATNHSINTELKEHRMTALQVARIETRLDALHHSITALREEIRSNNAGAKL